MTLPTGQISMAQVNVELGRPAGQRISMGDAAVRALAGLPSGQISMGQLRGKSRMTLVASRAVDLGSRAPRTGYDPASQAPNRYFSFSGTYPLEPFLGHAWYFRKYLFEPGSPSADYVHLSAASKTPFALDANSIRWIEVDGVVSAVTSVEINAPDYLGYRCTFRAPNTTITSARPVEVKVYS